MGAHSTGRKVWALGRWHRLNQALEALFVAALVAAAAYAGWMSTVAPRPLSSVLNQPHPAARLVDEPTDPPVPPVPAELLGRDTTPAPSPPQKREKVSTTQQSAAQPTPHSRS